MLSVYAFVPWTGTSLPLLDNNSRTCIVSELSPTWYYHQQTINMSVMWDMRFSKAMLLKIQVSWDFKVKQSKASGPWGLRPCGVTRRLSPFTTRHDIISQMTWIYDLRLDTSFHKYAILLCYHPDAVCSEDTWRSLIVRVSRNGPCAIRSPILLLSVAWKLICRRR